jgi:hypothetical protein
MGGSLEDRNVPAAVVRRVQERDIALVHSLTDAEHALARDAVRVGLTLARAGIDFDPRTLIALRIIEGSIDCSVDPNETLSVLHVRDTIERSVALTVDLLGGAGEQGVSPQA